MLLMVTMLLLHHHHRLSVLPLLPPRDLLSRQPHHSSMAATPMATTFQLTRLSQTPCTTAVPTPLGLDRAATLKHRRRRLIWPPITSSTILILILILTLLTGVLTAPPTHPFLPR